MTPQITIYSTPSCHFCHMAKEFLTEHNIPFTDHNVASDMDKRKEMIELTGQMGVPVIQVNDQIVIGYDEDALAELVGIKAA